MIDIRRNDFFLLRFIILLFFLYDFIIKILVSYNINFMPFYRYIIVYKTIIVLLIFRNLNNKKFQKSDFKTPIILLSVAYGVNQLLFFDDLDQDNILFNGYYFISSVLPLIYYSIFEAQENKGFLNIQIKVFLYLMIVNSILIFVGYFFKVDIFETYFVTGNRFGYQGFLLYHSEAGYLYFIAINLAYYFLRKRKTVIRYLVLILLFLSSFLIGTKKAFFLSIIFLIYFIIDNYKHLKQKTTYYYLLGFLLLIFVARKFFLDIFVKQFVLFEKLYIEKGFFTSFTSLRNVLLRKNFLPHINECWGILNHVFGGPKFSNGRTELEFFDLYLFFGIVGFFVYYRVLKKLLINKDRQIYFIVFALIFATAFAGNLFASLNTMIILYITIKFIDSKTDVNFLN